MNAILDQAALHWAYIAPLLSEPTNDDEYDAKVEALDELLNTIGDDENHPLAGLLDAWVMSSKPTTNSTGRCPRYPVPLFCAISWMSMASPKASYLKWVLNPWFPPSCLESASLTGVRSAVCPSGSGCPRMSLNSGPGEFTGLAFALVGSNRPAQVLSGMAAPPSTPMVPRRNLSRDARPAGGVRDDYQSLFGNLGGSCAGCRQPRRDFSLSPHGIEVTQRGRQTLPFAWLVCLAGWCSVIRKAKETPLSLILP